MKLDNTDTRSEALDDLELRLARAELLAGQAKTALGLILAVIEKAYGPNPWTPLQAAATGSERTLQVLDDLILDLDAGTPGHWKRMYESGARRLLSNLLEDRQVLFDTKSHPSN